MTQLYSPIKPQRFLGSAANALSLVLASVAAKQNMSAWAADFRRRRQRADESIEVMRRLWREGALRRLQRTILQPD